MTFHMSHVIGLRPQQNNLIYAQGQDIMNFMIFVSYTQCRMIYTNWLVNLQQEVRNWFSKFSWCLGSMYFYSRIICRCESSLDNSNFIFFKRNIGQVSIFVLKKVLEAGLISSRRAPSLIKLTLATRGVFFATILAIF